MAWQISSPGSGGGGGSANVPMLFSNNERITSVHGTAVGSPTIAAPFGDSWYTTTPCNATNNDKSPITLALGNVAAIQYDLSLVPAGAVMSAATISVQAAAAVVTGTVQFNSPSTEVWDETTIACNNAPALTNQGTVVIPALAAGATAALALTAGMMTYLSGRFGQKGSIFISCPNATPTGTLGTKDQAVSPFNMPLSFTFTLSF